MSASDKVPTFKEIGELSNLAETDIQWALVQLSLGNQTEGVETRTHPTPVCVLAAKDGVQGMTVAGSYLVYVNVTKAGRQVIYVPLAEAILGVASNGTEVTLSAKIGSEGISLAVDEGSAATEKAKAKESNHLGVGLTRIHAWIRSTVIDYRRN